MTTQACWCGRGLARHPGRGRPLRYCSRAHYPSGQPARRRGYKQAAQSLAQRLDARAAALDLEAAVPESAAVGTLTRAVYAQAIRDDDRAWLADRDAQGLWGVILDELRGMACAA